MGVNKLQEALGNTVRVNVPMSPFTTLKIGGPADYFLEARSKEQLVNAVRVAHEFSIPVTVIGGGSNILVGDNGIRGLVIKVMMNSIVVKGMKGKLGQGQSSGSVYVEADAGVLFNSFVRFAIEEGYGGIEMHLGLPGTVGGAIYMNSKWTHPEGYVGDRLFQADILDRTGQITTVPRSYFQFAYDTSMLQKTSEILLSATFEFFRSTKEELWKRANESVAYRRASQPQGVFTPGCTFRNISASYAYMLPTPNHTQSAGYLIDTAGLKGYRIGNAQVSPVHANFIVNTGGATAADVVHLITHIQNVVQKKYGLLLEEEIVRIGEF